jgi:hypothetical protein
VSVIAYSALILIAKSNPGIPSLPASVRAVSFTTLPSIQIALIGALETPLAPL